MQALARNRKLLRWSGVALICYGGLLFVINNLRQHSNVTIVGSLPQNPSPVQTAPVYPAQPNLQALKPAPHIATSSRGDVQLGQTLVLNHRGELIVINNSKRGFPILSLGPYKRFEAKSFDPTAHFHVMLTSADYEEWFNTNRRLLLQGFGEPEEICKTPVLLGEVPNEPHTLTITITTKDAKKCLGFR